MRVLVVHNRYRIQGGEERSVELQLEALRHAGVAHALLERRSADLSRAQAALALLRGGRDEGDVEAATRELNADVVHVHNMLPLPGPRGLEAARSTGAAVLLHLHNLRLFCAIGVAARDGGPCFRCHHRNTLPGLVLNCRGSLPEAAVYAAALARHQPTVFEAVDRFVVPSGYAAGQSALMGVPGDRLDVLPHYLPAEAFAEHSRADQGSYALVASRLSPEKGIDAAIEAAASTGIPLRVAGEGPAAAELRALAERRGAPVEFTGRLRAREPRPRARRRSDGADALALPRVLPLLRARGDGRRRAGDRLRARRPPELLGAKRCVPAGDAAALAGRMTALWESPELAPQRGRRADREGPRRARRGALREPPPRDLHPRAPVVERVGHGLLQRDRRRPPAGLGERGGGAAHLRHVVCADAGGIDLVADLDASRARACSTISRTVAERPQQTL